MALASMFSAASGVIEAPDLWEKRLPAAMAALAPKLVQTDGGLVWQVGDRRTAPLALDASVPGATGPLGRSDIAWLATADGRRWVQERDQVSGEVLYAVGEVWDLIDASEDDAFKAACARAYNDWLAELCSADPERFVGAAKIPTSGIDDAVAELGRAVETLGLRA
ncbi:MAG: amidohydrolase family protein, partial [Alphaproteobacteria bacterium]|nr:amidohydrolase family protein [Alphaproteobacteria bacterium]